MERQRPWGPHVWSASDRGVDLFLPPRMGVLEPGGVGGVGRTVLGVLILTVLSNGLNQIGAADYTQTVIRGLVIIVAAVFTTASQRKLIVK